MKLPGTFFTSAGVGALWLCSLVRLGCETRPIICLASLGWELGTEGDGTNKPSIKTWFIWPNNLVYSHAYANVEAAKWTRWSEAATGRPWLWSFGERLSARRPYNQERICVEFAGQVCYLSDGVWSVVKALRDILTEVWLNIWQLTTSCREEQFGNSRLLLITCYAFSTISPFFSQKERKGASSRYKRQTEHGGELQPGDGGARAEEGQGWQGLPQQPVQKLPEGAAWLRFPHRDHGKLWEAQGERGGPGLLSQDSGSR